MKIERAAIVARDAQGTPRRYAAYRRNPADRWTVMPVGASNLDEQLPIGLHLDFGLCNMQGIRVLGWIEPRPAIAADGYPIRSQK
jgi:hypothetical protein